MLNKLTAALRAPPPIIFVSEWTAVRPKDGVIFADFTSGPDNYTLAMGMHQWLRAHELSTRAMGQAHIAHFAARRPRLEHS